CRGVNGEQLTCEVTPYAQHRTERSHHPHRSWHARRNAVALLLAAGRAGRRARRQPAGEGPAASGRRPGVVPRRQRPLRPAGAPPAFPHFDCFVAPGSHTFAFKGMIDCNWLQSLEVGIDPAHTSFLHRFFHDEEPDTGYGKLFRDKSIDSDLPMTRIMREHPRPRIEVEPTEFGMRVLSLRRISDTNSHVRVTNLVFPHGFVIPMSSEMTITQWHVPIDDCR